MCQKAPDTKGINRAAEATAKLSAEALAWAKQIYAEEAPARAETAALDKRVADSAIAGMDFATMQAKDNDQRYKTTFQPLEDKLATDALAYDTPERQADAAQRATADVETRAGRALADHRRDTLRLGGTLDDGRSGALDIALGKARMGASAADQAVQAVKGQGYARMMDAVGLGKGVVGAQATQQQIATGQGRAAVDAAGAGLGATMAGHGVMQQGFGTAIQGQQASGNLYGQAAQLKQQAGGSGVWGALGNVAGQFAGSGAGSAMLAGLSDKDKKKKTGKVTDGSREMAELRETPVHQDWQYAPEKGGLADGGVPHTGPMAQGVQAAMGNEVAPGGEVIDLVSMNGKLMASMQNIDRRLQRVEKKKVAQ
jgi:hypothetical protein